MKKIIALLALAAVAFTASARTFTIGLGNGDIKLDRKYLQYGSADLIGIECITANDTGDVTLAVGKHMEAQQKIVDIHPVYETNIVHVTDWWEYDWLAKETIVSNDVTMVHRYTMKFNGHTDWTGASSYEVKYADIPAGEMYPKYSEGADDGYSLIEYMMGANSNKVDVFSLTLDLGLIQGGTNPVVVDERLNIVGDSAVLTNVNWGSAYNPDGITMRIEYERADHSTWIEHWHNVTNVVQVGLETNITWKAVDRTCYQGVTSTNLTDGIVIQYFDNPIRLFRNDYIRSTCPIDDETNPGIYNAIMKDEGAASIIL